MGACFLVLNLAPSPKHRTPINSATRSFCFHVAWIEVTNHINKYFSLFFFFTAIQKQTRQYLKWSTSAHKVVWTVFNAGLLSSYVLPQVCRRLQSCGIPLPIPGCFCCHPGDHSSSSVCPTVPWGCLPRGPAVAGPSLPVSCTLRPGNTPFLPAGHTHCPCQLSKSGDGQVCVSAWHVEHTLQKSGNC